MQFPIPSLIFICSMTARRSPIELSPEISPEFLATLREYDVLCGRAKQVFANPGNRTFRHVVQQRRKTYRETTRRAEKSAITQSVIQLFRENSGRFLKLDESGSGSWVELSDEQVKEKVSHALRGSKSPNTTKTKPKGPSRLTETSPSVPRIVNAAFQAISERQQAIFQSLLRDDSESKASESGEDDSESWSFEVSSTSQTEDVDGSVDDGNCVHIDHERDMQHRWPPSGF